MGRKAGERKHQVQFEQNKHALGIKKLTQRKHEIRV